MSDQNPPQKKLERIRHRVMVVDDDQDVAGTFKLCLEESGFTVETFNDPEMALSHFEAGKYDILLIDIRMPNMNGFELYENIRKKDDNPKTKVCFITAFQAYYESLLESFPSLDVKCFIRKPIGKAELAERIAAEMD